MTKKEYILEVKNEIVDRASKGILYYNGQRFAYMIIVNLLGKPSPKWRGFSNMEKAKKSLENALKKMF